jgi:tetratricopeptide (TPR) repeat protein
LLHLLNNLKSLKREYGQNYLSIPNLLNIVGNILDESKLSLYSISFFKEQLRIEKYYLGDQHHDLAITLNRIGEIHMKIDQLSEAAEYFSQVFAILNKNNRKGLLYAQVVYNTGLVKYHNALYDDALELLKLAINEHRIALGDFHLDVAEICMKVGDLQLELGKLQEAMDSYLEALMILRMIHGSMHSKVYLTLYKIGLIHKARGDYGETLNAFYQALDIMRNLEVDEEDASIIIILYEIGTINQCIGNISNAIVAFEETIELLRLKLGEDHICVASVLGQVVNMCTEYGMIKQAKILTDEIQIICSKNNSIEQECSDNDDYIDAVIKTFGHAIDVFHLPAAAA